MGARMGPTYEQLALVYDAVADPIILMDVEGDELRVVSVNAAFTTLMGLKPAVVVGKTLSALFSTPRGLRYAEMCRVAVREQRVMQYEEHAEIDGREISGHVSLTPIVTEGRCTQLLSLTRDITEQTRVMREHRLHFEYAPEAVLTFDLESRRFIEVNARACELFEGTREELLQLGPVDISPERQPDGSSSAERAAPKIEGAKGVVNVFEWTHQSLKGRLIPCEVRIVSLPGPTRRVRGSVIDITDRKQAEELKRLSAALLDEKRVAEARSRVKSELIANLSHELRTPLNAILGFGEILHDGRVGALNADQTACLADILGSGYHLLGLINGMLDLAKAEAGRMEMKPARTAIRPLVAEATELVRALAAQKAIAVEVSVEPAVDEVMIDRARLKQVMLNYLSNALKFTEDGGRVVIRVRREGAMFRVDVEDTGIGIRPEDIPRLFVEFTQLETGLGRRHEGTGLGLALSKRIVELQGGSVGVESVLGKGSTFWARLPRGDVDAR